MTGYIIDMEAWQGRATGRLQYPFRQLDIGESFRTPPDRSDISKLGISCRSALTAYGMAGRLFQFTMEPDGRILVTRLA